MTQQEWDGYSIEPMVVDAQGIIFVSYPNAYSETGIITSIWKWIHCQALEYHRNKNNYGYGSCEFHFPVCLGQTKCISIVTESSSTLKKISAWMINSMVSLPMTFRIEVISHSYIFLLLLDLIKTDLDLNLLEIDGKSSISHLRGLLLPYTVRELHGFMP